MNDNKMTLSDFVNKIKNSLDVFEKNMRNLGGEFIEAKTLVNWLTTFSNWLQ